MLRFSLGTLLLLVLVACFGCAALVNASPLWEQITLSLTVAVLSLATIGAVYLPPQARAFFGGFALLGWIYLVLVTIPSFDAIKPRLLTTTAISTLYELQAEDEPQDTGMMGGGMMGGGMGDSMGMYGGGGMGPGMGAMGGGMDEGYGYGGYGSGSGPGVRGPDPISFHRIGHAVWALILGFIGGGVAGFCSRWRRKEGE